MSCCICGGELDKKYMINPQGEEVMYWNKGENAQPVKEGRCCTTCNLEVVLPTRLKTAFMATYTESEEE